MNALDVAILRARACKVEKIQRAAVVAEEPIDHKLAKPIEVRLTDIENRAMERLAEAESRIARLEQYFRKDISPLTSPPDEGSMEYRPSMGRILATVSRFYEVPAIDIQSDRRDKRSTVARQVFMYLSKQLTLRSLHVIGAFVRKRDHTTVMHGVRTITRLRLFDPKLNEELDALARALKQTEGEEQCELAE